ncbi:Protein eva-1 -like protein C Protein FAM176C Precursor [Channa argus]|uniref:Protein eva-1-like protein C Protein FAM176C n=1 Tax=Channa argus TaxID=215402 RepID=A0A6G1PVB1_CHAAH|nr:Protein eva-1 -like protein C Protein FAM176C Precursor [Channa argus]
MTLLWSFCWSFSILPLLLALKMHIVHSAPDFSLYLHTILKNHTAHACEGDMLIIECPSRTSVAILSAFYGRRVPNQHLCPSANTNTTVEENTECTSSVVTEKVLSECQDRRSCHIPVLSPVFGQDPCPLTSKYLLVSYKCRPEHHRTRLVCENERLKLTCKNETVLAIYSATFGHLLHGSPYCPQEPGSQIDMVPRYLLEDVGRGSTDPFMISDYTHGGWYTGPTYRHQNVLLTNSLEIIEKILGLPEKVALYFVSGICAGLVFLLCLFGLRSTLVRDVKNLVSDLNDELKASHSQNKEMMEDLYDDDISDTSSFRHLTQCYRTTDIFSPSSFTIEMVEREVGQMRDQPNGDIWPHRDSSPYAIHKIKTYNN